MSAKLASDGYTVYAGCLDINSDGAKALAATPNVNVLQMNVTQQSDVDAAAQKLNQELWERGKVLMYYCKFGGK